MLTFEQALKQTQRPRMDPPSFQDILGNATGQQDQEQEKTDGQAWADRLLAGGQTQPAPAPQPKQTAPKTDAVSALLNRMKEIGRTVGSLAQGEQALTQRPAPAAMEKTKERESLLQELRSVQDQAGYITDAQEGLANKAREKELIGQIEALDKQLGNKGYYTSADQLWATITGADMQKANSNSERDALLKELQSVQDEAGYLTDPDAAMANKAKEREIIERLDALDQELGNNARYYSNADRFSGTLAGSVIGQGAAYTNAAGTIASMAGAGDEFTRAINDSPYAGYMTDPLTEANSRQAYENGWRPESTGTLKQQEEFAQKAFAVADRLDEKSQGYLQRAKEGAGALDRLGVDMTKGAVDLAADALANRILPGTGLFNMGVRSFGQEAMDLRHQGYSASDQILGGFKSAAIEILTEKIGGPFERVYGKTALGGVSRNLLGKISDPRVMRLVGLLGDGLGEAGEEILSDLLNPAADRLFGLYRGDESYWQQITDKEFVENALYDGLLGGLLGLAGGVANISRGGEVTPQERENIKRVAAEAAEAAVDKAVGERIVEEAEKGKAEEETKPAEEIAPQEEEKAPAPTSPQEATGALLAQGNTDTAPQGVQAPAEGPALLNSEQGAKDAVPRKKGRSDTEKAATRQRGFEQSRRVLEHESQERQDFLKNKWREHAGFLEKLKAGDKVYIDGRGIPAFEVVDADEYGMTILFYGADGEAFQMERVLPDTLTGDTLYNTLEAAETVDINRPEQGANGEEAQQNITEKQPIKVKVRPHQANAEVTDAQTGTAVEAQQETGTSSVPAEAETPSPQGEGMATQEQLAEQEQKPAPREHAQDNYTEADRQAADEKYQQLGERYGAIEPGETPARESSVPKQINETQKTGETARTIYEAAATPESRLPDVRSAVLDGKFSYESVSNESLVKEAEGKVEKDGWEKTLRDWTADVRGGKVSDNLVALGAVLLNNAANSNMSGADFVDIAADYYNLCHKSANSLQANRILKSLSPEGRLYMIQRSVTQQLENTKLSQEEKQKVITEAVEYGKELNGIKEGDTEGLKDFVKRMAKRRKNWTLLKGNLERLLNKQDEDFLRGAAHRQIDALGRDAANRGLQNVGAKIQAYRVLSMLSGLPTVGGNIVGNVSFGNLFDFFAEQGPGRAIDALLGNLTGQRAVVGSRGPVWETVPEWWKNASSLFQQSLLESALDIDMDSDMSRPMEMPANSSFVADSNKIEHLMQRWSQIMNYLLVGTDRFSRGGIEGGEAANYAAFDERQAAKGKSGTGLSEEERSDLIKGWSDYRLFQNKNAFSKAQKELRRMLNNAVGIGGKVDAKGNRISDNTFGLGSMLMPFIEVPTNLALKTWEWGPGNLISGGKNLGKLLWAVHKNNVVDKTGTGEKVSTAKLQQQTSMDFARGITGSGFIALATWLAHLGLIKNDDDEDDYNVSAVNRITGLRGTQINLSGIDRAMSGESAEWTPQDVTLGLDRIQPLNMWLKAGVLLNDVLESDGFFDKSAGEQIKEAGAAYLKASAQSILDMPLFQNMKNITDTFRYADSLETADDYLKFAGKLAGTAADNQMSSFIPQIIRQSAKAADPYVRDTSSDSWMQARLNNAMQYIPGLRNKLPEKIDSFGEPMKQPGTDEERWINALLSPVSFSTYETNEVVDMLAGLREETGKSNYYPDYKAPNKVDLPNADGGTESVELNTEQKRAFQETAGQAYTRMMEGFKNTEGWDDLNADDRKKLAEQAKSLSKDLAKRQLAESLGRPYSSDWDDELEDIPPEFLADYLTTRQAFKSAIKESDFDAVDALLADMGKHDDVVTEYLLDDITRLDDRQEAYKAGISSEEWSKAYEQYLDISKRSESAQQKGEDMAKYLAGSGLSRYKQNILRDQFKFYSMIQANTDKYDAMTAAGFSPEKADMVTSLMADLKPDADHASVTQNQKINAIRGANLTEAEKWAALKIYASDSCYKKAMEAKAAGKSFFQWALEYTGK